MPVHSYALTATLDCAALRCGRGDFYHAVMEQYQEKFAVEDIADFPPYDRFVCDYAEYEILNAGGGRGPDF